VSLDPGQHLRQQPMQPVQLLGLDSRGAQGCRLVGRGADTPQQARRHFHSRGFFILLLQYLRILRTFLTTTQTTAEPATDMNLVHLKVKTLYSHLNIQKLYYFILYYYIN